MSSSARPLPIRPLLVLLLLVFIAGYFWIDVRQRARLDRGVKKHRTDFTVYQYASRALVAGEDPYEATNPRGYRYVYPPLLAVLLMPLASWDPPDAALVWYLLSMGALLYALWALVRLRLPGTTGPLGWTAVLVAGITCLGFAHQGFQRGQITQILLGLHVGALVALYRGRPGWAGLLLAIGAALRLTPLLVAGAVGLGLLAGMRRDGPGGVLRYSAGLGAGLLLGFVVIPVVGLGAERAQAVSERWVEATRSVYAENEEFDERWKINEWRFKNQAPRRVYGTWLGWATGAPFEKEKPALGAHARAVMDGAATGTTLVLALLAVLLGLRWMQRPDGVVYAGCFALLTLLPVLMTRYTWPTHYLLALPAVALAAAPIWQGQVLRRGRWILLVGALLFYAAHAKALLVIGQVGCLLLACAAFIFVLLRACVREARS